MAGFLTPLDLEYIDGCHWKVIKSFEYCLKEPDAPDRVVIPEGFITDFASIPRVLWPVLPPTGKYGKAAVVHDALYTNRTVTMMWADPESTLTARYVNRGQADHILLEAMQVLGVSWLTRSTVYAGVRSGGWHSWNKHRQEEKPPCPPQP